MRDRSAAALAFVLVLSACGGGSDARDSGSDMAQTDAGHDAGGDAGSDAGSDAGTDAGHDGGFTVGPHAALPQLPDQGGPRRLHPAVVTITFAGDPRRAALEAYAAWLVGSDWLLAVGADYGVGAGTVGGAVQLAMTAPTTITGAEVETLIASGIMDGSIPTPPGGIDTAIYVVYFPSTTTITARCGAFPALESCTAFGGIHTDGSALGLQFAYAVLPDCGTIDASLTALETVEYSASHEIIEAATDPFSFSDPAYQLLSDPTDPWFASLGCEVENADLCAIDISPTRESGHVAQRNWSNSAAAASQDPCVPSDPAVPYFNVTASPTTTQHVAPGGRVDYTLQGWSTAPVPDWHLSTIVFPPLSGTALSVTTSFDTTTINNGRTATLHVTAAPGAAAGSSATVYVVSSSGSVQHTWIVQLASP